MLVRFSIIMAILGQLLVSAADPPSAAELGDDQIRTWNAVAAALSGRSRIPSLINMDRLVLRLTPPPIPMPVNGTVGVTHQLQVPALNDIPTAPSPLLADHQQYEAMLTAEFLAAETAADATIEAAVHANNLAQAGVVTYAALLLHFGQQQLRDGSPLHAAAKRRSSFVPDDQHAEDEVYAIIPVDVPSDTDEEWSLSISLGFQEEAVQKKG